MKRIAMLVANAPVQTRLRALAKSPDIQAHIHHPQGDKQRGQQIQPILIGAQLVGDHDRADEKRQRLKAVGLRRVGATAPLGLLRQPIARVAVVIAAFAQRHKASGLGDPGTYNRQHGGGQYAPIGERKMDHWFSS